MCDIMLSSYVLQCSDNMGSGASASNMPVLFRRDFEEMKEVWIKSLLLLNQIPAAFELSQRYHYFYGTHSLTHLTTYSLTHLTTYSLTHLTTYLLTHSLTQGLPIAHIVFKIKK
jgi:hypothetical protein